MVCGEALGAVVAESLPDPLGARVREPPPTVVTMVTPCELTLVMTAPLLSVSVTSWPCALVLVTTSPAVRGLVPAAGVVAAAPESDADADADATASGDEELAPGSSGEVLVDVTVIGAFVDDAGPTEASVVGLPTGSVSVPVVIGGTGVATVSDASGVLVLPGTTGGVDVVTVPLLMSCRFASATMLLAIDASSLCSASAAVRSFSNMPWVNFLGE